VLLAGSAQSFWWVYLDQLTSSAFLATLRGKENVENMKGEAGVVFPFLAFLRKIKFIIH
jgi:hypothetical protein